MQDKGDSPQEVDIPSEEIPDSKPIAFLQLLRAKKLLFGILSALIFISATVLVVIYKCNFNNVVDKPDKPDHVDESSQGITEQILVTRIDPPVKSLLKIWLNTSSGKYPLVEAVNKKVSDYIGNSIKIFDNQIIFYDEDSLNIFNKSNKEIYEVPFPDEIINRTNKSEINISIESFNDNNKLVSLRSSKGDQLLGTYLIDINKKTLTSFPTGGVKCSNYLCGGPYIEGDLGNGSYLIIYRSGDACWGTGDITRYNLPNNTANLVLSYSVGCVDNQIIYLGYANNFVFAAHGTGSDSSSGYTLDDIYKIDPYNLEEQIVLEKDQIPENVDLIWSHPETHLIYMEGENDNQYVYNPFSDQFALVAQHVNDLARESPYKIIDVEEILTSNNDYIGYSTEDSDFGEITAVTVGRDGFYVKDATNNTNKLIDFAPLRNYMQEANSELTESRYYTALSWSFVAPEIKEDNKVYFKGEQKNLNTTYNTRFFFLDLSTGEVYEIKTE